MGQDLRGSSTWTHGRGYSSWAWGAMGEMEGREGGGKASGKPI